MSADKFRVSSLPSAGSGVVSVSPSSTVVEATSIMLMHDYSQLPVMCGERHVKGVISWKSLGSTLQLRGPVEQVRECMDPNFEVVSPDTNVIKAVRKIIRNDYVLVQEKSGIVCGIFTLYDIGTLFQGHSEPFIEIEQIELLLRELIVDHVTSSDLESIASELGLGGASRVEDWTFGGYVRWLSKPENWERMGLSLDRKVFIKRLGKVNQIRNELMHFRAEEISDEDLRELKIIGKFFRLARKMVASSRPEEVATA